MSRVVDALKSIGRVLNRPLWPQKPEIVIPSSSDDRTRWWDVVFGAFDFLEGIGCLLQALAGGVLCVFGWLASRAIF